MPTLKPLYGTDTSITITSAASLANGSYAGSAAVDNTTTLAEDALVSVAVATGGSGVVATGTVSVYAYAETDGTHYTDGVTGTDATQTPTSPTNLKLIGVISTPATSTTYRGGPFSVAKAFGGILPAKWGIVLLNSSGGALAGSGTSADFMPINEQSV